MLVADGRKVLSNVASGWLAVAASRARSSFAAIRPEHSWPERRETDPGPAAGPFRDRAHRRRTCQYGEDARRNETARMRGPGPS